MDLTRLQSQKFFLWWFWYKYPSYTSELSSRHVHWQIKSKKKTFDSHSRLVGKTPFYSPTNSVSLLFNLWFLQESAYCIVLYYQARSAIFFLPEWVCRLMFALLGILFYPRQDCTFPVQDTNNRTTSNKILHLCAESDDPKKNLGWLWLAYTIRLLSRGAVIINRCPWSFPIGHFSTAVHFPRD